MQDIKNIGIFAHVDAGKTTLTEQMLYLCGMIRKAGSVDDGTAQTDWLSIERERGISVRSAAAHMQWKDTVINIIDTPGHIDFAGEAERVLIALDGAVLVVSAVEGVQSHTENLWKACKRINLPCIIFINKIDRAGSDTVGLLEQFSDRLGGDFLYITEPENEGFRECIVKNVEFDKIMEKVADYDDEVAEAFLDGKLLSAEIIDNKLNKLIYDNKITPVLCGSAQLGIGVDELLDAVGKYLPSANVKAQDNLSGLIYKIEHDKDIGKIAHIRMFGGTIKNRDIIKDGQKVTQIRRFNGSRYIDTGEVSAGDIAALCGLENLRVGDIIGELADMGIVQSLSENKYQLVNPFLTVRAIPKSPEELTPLINAIKELCEEEPLIDYKWEKSEREIHLNLTGEIQLEVITALLKERYNLAADFTPLSVIYKETPAKNGDGFEAYTMPKPCWAVVHFNFDPLPRGSGVVYDGGHLPHNQLAYKYQTHIQECFFNSLEQGNYGWAVTDFKATLVGGEHHFIHTHPLDFFVATPMAIMDGLNRTGTILLEPLMKFHIKAAEEHLGRVISDVTLMRGEFDTPVVMNGKFEIDTILPAATSLDYPIKLAMMSGGKATYNAKFYGYKDCPLELGATAKRRGINPLDRAKWILHARGAIQ